MIVIPAYFTVIPDSIRDPVLRQYWIADQVRNDKGVAMTQALVRSGVPPWS
jgi:hypothetical protein